MASTFKVPIKNVFYMLSYVNDMPEFIEQLSDTDEDVMNYDFLAKRFNDEVNQLLKRGFMRNYITHTEETGFISGRMLMNESIPFIVEKKPRVVCEKDDYSQDIIFNQILKTTLKSLVSNRHVKEETRNKSFMLWEEMPFVNDIVLSRKMFKRFMFNRHNVHYKRVIHIARLLYEVKWLSHQQGDWSLFTVDMEERELNRLFENFLFHFYRIEQGDYRVKSERMTWHLQGGNESLLPTMLTDVSLIHRKKAEKVIIDAKFYRHIFQTYYDKHSFHSHNLYQLFTYLMHQAHDLEQLRGILIYPFNGADIKETYEWDKRVLMEVRTINLGNKWNAIYDELMAIILN